MPPWSVNGDDHVRFWRMAGTMAFMFETRFPQQLTEFAASLATLQDDYPDCWSGIVKNFDPTRRDWTL
jgi:homogentisate 1,2-dioxygenase